MLLTSMNALSLNSMGFHELYSLGQVYIYNIICISVTGVFAWRLFNIRIPK